MSRKTHALATGIFLTLLLTALAITVYWIGNFQRERNHYVISTRDSVSGLNPESTVFYRGIAVGKVLKVFFDPEDAATILVSIEVDRDLKFTRGLYATLRLKGVTGLTQIDLQDAGNNDEPLPPGDNTDTRIPLLPSLTDRLMNSGIDILAKAEILMTKIDGFLSRENEAHGVSILRNLNTVTGKLIGLEDQLDRVLKDIPDLAVNAKNTLQRVDDLTQELKNVTEGIHELTEKTSDLAVTGNRAGHIILETTLPEVNETLAQLQQTILQIKRVGELVEHNPQAVILGPGPAEPGPGEPGYVEVP
ncbi:MAG: MlaD family protein [Gammaproteobacteria bacterium]